MTPSNEPTKALMPCPDGTVVYLLMVNELEQDGHARDYVRDAFSTREEAEAACAEAKRRYEARVSKMTGQQRHRHTMESFSVEEVTVTNSAPLPGVTMGGEVISEALVDRMAEAYWNAEVAVVWNRGQGQWRSGLSEAQRENRRGYMRAALSAALSLAAKPQSAKVREVSEKDVERACNQWCDYINNVVHRPRHDFNQRAIPDDKMRSCMRSALVAYERGRK